MRLSSQDAAARFTAARVARLATVDGTGRPHLVPVTFALRDDVIVIAVDHKPKESTDLKRLRNIDETGLVSLLADEYDDHHWERLWWARADGRARITAAEDGHSADIGRLCKKYEQYRTQPPLGPVIRVDVHRFTGWAYREPSNPSR